MVSAAASAATACDQLRSSGAGRINVRITTSVVSFGPSDASAMCRRKKSRTVHCGRPAARAWQ